MSEMPEELKNLKGDANIGRRQFSRSPVLHSSFT